MQALAPTYAASVNKMDERLPPIPDKKYTKAHLLVLYHYSIKDPIIV